MVSLELFQISAETNRWRELNKIDNYARCIYSFAKTVNLQNIICRVLGSFFNVSIRSNRSAVLASNKLFP